MNKKHLLLLTPGFAANEADTTCIPALQLYVKELLRREQFEITILTFHYPYKAREYGWNKAKVIALGGNNNQGVQRLVNLRKAFRIIKRLHIKNSIDFIQSFWLGECAWIGQKISIQFLIPHSCTLMGQDALKTTWLIKRLKILPKLITLSRFHSQQLLKNTQLTADLIIPWGVVEKEINTKTRSIDILGVGSLTALKAFDRFLGIVLKLKVHFPTIKAEIIGVGPQNKALKELIESYQLSENISLIGKLEREFVMAKMAESRCLLHCSQYESFGMVIPEALSMGTHVFSTAVGIAPELESVFLFETNDQAVSKINNFLQKEHKFIPEYPCLISETVDSYINNVFLN